MSDLAMAYRMKKRMGKCMAKGGYSTVPEGVHASIGDTDKTRGKSLAGLFSRAAKSGAGSIPKETLNKWAKQEHEMVRKELKDMKKPDLYAAGGFVDEEEESGYPEELVSRIMKSRYSEGGQIANDSKVLADFMDAQYDVLPKEDDLESSYTGENSGDEIGNEQEDMDRKDIISRIMKSRSKKDRMPRPA